MESKRQKKFILMLGASPSGKGGVASVVSVYIESGLLEDFPIQYIVTHSSGGPRDKIRVAVKALRSLLWRLIRREVAVVHVHSASDGSFVRKSILLATARLFGVKTIFHLHGGEFHKFVGQRAGYFLGRWVRHTLARSDAVVVLSKTWAEFIEKLVPGVSPTIIPNPVHIPATATHANELAGRIIFLGRAEKHKGIFDLIDALSLILQRRPDAKLIVGGDGDLDALRHYADAKHVGKHHLDILGWVGPDERHRELQAAQVFVLPSYNEGLPMAMLEAMSYAKAIVVSPVGGIPEAVSDGEHALFAQPGDVSALARALELALDDHLLRTRLGEAARLKVAATYSANRILQLLGDLYERLGVRRDTQGRSDLGVIGE